jgi:hypothetical protein
MVNLVTVKNRELMKVGKWAVHSGGEFNVTPDLIKAALSAHEAGVLRKPVIRLGHNDARFTGDPAMGWVDNVRASEDGSTLYGDLVGVPKWLADNMPAAYPSLSIEGMYGYTAPDGTTHDFILTGLGLLGATPPGIGALKSVQDVEALFSDEAIAAAVGEIGGTAVSFTVEAAGNPKPYGDVKYADPKNGKYPIDTKEHVKAAWDYINMPKNQKEFSAEELAQIKSRIKSAATKFGIKIEASEASQEEGAVVTAISAQLAEALGIDASADEATALAKIAEFKTRFEAEPEPQPEPQPEQVAAAAAQLGLVMVNKEQYDATVAAAAAGQEAREQQIREADEGIVMAAIKDGKIPPARRDHWLGALKADRDGTKTVLASLAKGLIPLVEAGHGFGTEEVPEVDTELQRVEDRVFASLGITKKAGTN